MGLADLKPVAKSTLLGTIAGGVTGFIFGGPAGAMTGANFGGSLGTQVGIYNKGEEIANRAVESAGRRFEQVTERTGRRMGRAIDRTGRAVERGINEIKEKLISGIEKGANIYSKAVIAGTIGSYTLEYSRYSGISAKDICISENEWLQCYLLRGAMAIFLSATVLSAYLLVKDLKKLRNEGLFDAPITNQTIRRTFDTSGPETQTRTHRTTITQTTVHQSAA